MRLSLTKDLQPLITAALAEIEEQARLQRAKHNTADKADIYRQKREEAERWQAAGEPADLSDYPWLEAETGVSAETTPSLASLWIAMSNRWLRIGPGIERVAQQAKLDVRAAKSPAEIQAVVEGLNWP